MQKHSIIPFRVTKADIQQFIGLVFIMSLVYLPRVTKHWRGGLRTPLVKDTMPVNEIENIIRFIYFNDNSKMVPRDHANHDHLYKIRPVVTTMKQEMTRSDVLPFPGPYHV